MDLAIIPDEISHDPFTAIELCKELGINNYEIRYAYRWRVPVAPEWVSGRTIAACKAFDVNVTAISPGIFKPTMQVDGTNIPISIDTPDEIRRHIDEVLPQAFDLAEELGTDKLTVFALGRGEAAVDAPIPQIVIDSLAEVAGKGDEAGITILLENGAGSWADSGSATAALLKAVNHPNLKVTWDPANVVYGGCDEEPVSEGYPLVAGYVGNVHVKDTVYKDGGIWMQFGEGVIDWKAQLAALQTNGYEGCLTIEPHLQYQETTGLVALMTEYIKRVQELVTL